MDHHSACLLLLLLTCLAGFSASEAEDGGYFGDFSYGPSSVEINGVSVVTVGIPYGFQCTAKCHPGCTYSWTRGNVTSQGPELSLQLLQLESTQTLTCTVVNPATGKSASVSKTLQVTAGPSNIRISGPTFLTIGVESNFSCSASCYPSCSYTWTVAWEGQTLNTVQSSSISVAPARSTVLSETLTCEAQDTVSLLYISTTLKLPVASISDVSIVGESTVTMGKEVTFTCSAVCNPACSIVWLYMGNTYQGDQIQITIMIKTGKKKFASHLKITFSDYSKTEPLTCVATNTASHATATSTKNLTVIDPFSVRPTSQALAVAGRPFSLQCVGSLNPASITWLKNKLPMPASERVHFSPDNTTMTFSPLLQDDDGLYQCVVTEGVGPIQSVGYKMQVNYGPSSAVITGVDVMTVGLPYDFQCSASCFPTCQFTWTRGNLTYQGPKLRLQLKELQPDQKLTCTAVNPATQVSATAQVTLQVIDGPSNIHISGPKYLTQGATSNFTCSADCYSSCSYSWTVTSAEVTLSTAVGSTISVTPPADPVLSETLICQVQDSLSQISGYQTLQLPVTSLSNVTIAGESFVEIGKQYTYTCTAMCTPSCAFTWWFMGKIVKGEHLEITVSDYSVTELLTCEARNTVSNATITANMDLTVIDPFSVRPKTQALAVAGRSFSLQCVGPQGPASITWLKDKLPMSETERVHFSPDNTTITFDPLLRDDGGLYQCLVVEGVNRTLYYNTLVVEVEGGTPILSVGFLLVVNYGPDEVLIVKPNEGPVGEVMFALLGSTTELQCEAACFPACNITWFYSDTLLSTNATILFTPLTPPPYEAALVCVAFNFITRQMTDASTTVVVPDGPHDVVIEGPDSLEIGVTASFTCYAICSPSCTFTWTLYGKTMTGSSIDITVNRHVASESISCRAENTFTGNTATMNETLAVSDPHWCGC